MFPKRDFIMKSFSSIKRRWKALFAMIITLVLVTGGNRSALTSPGSNSPVLTNDHPNGSRIASSSVVASQVTIVPEASHQPLVNQTPNEYQEKISAISSQVLGNVTEKSEVIRRGDSTFQDIAIASEAKYGHLPYAEADRNGSISPY